MEHDIADKTDRADKLTPDCEECLPKWLSCGWLASPYTWYYIVLTTIAIIILYSCGSHASKDPHFKNLKKPAGDAGVTGLETGWLIAYIGMAIGLIIASWAVTKKNPSGSNTKAMCLAIVYTFLLIALACWESAYFVQYMFEWGLAAIILSIILILWLIWLVNPCRTRCGGSGGYFPYVWLFLVLGWMLVVTYYTISHVAMKSSTQIGKSGDPEVDTIVGAE